tara:strand:- start:1021 stop:1599 length:579 start_codon:yes stop_codon:yes gene_type:complete
MANVEHSILTGSALHEPKGAAAAGSGQVYVANGSGSGVWQPIHRHLGVTTSFSKSSPYAYSLDTDISEKLLNFSPSASDTVTSGFSVITSPTLRFRYDDSTTLTGLINVTMSSSQSTGPTKDVEWTLFKNSFEIAGSRSIRSISTGTWGSISVTGLTELVQNDSITIGTKANADDVVVNYANIYVSIIGMSA